MSRPKFLGFMSWFRASEHDGPLQKAPAGLRLHQDKRRIKNFCRSQRRTDDDKLLTCRTDCLGADTSKTSRWQIGELNPHVPFSHGKVDDTRHLQHWFRAHANAKDDGKAFGDMLARLQYNGSAIPCQQG